MPILDLFWSMLMFFLFFLWIWLLIKLFADVFRRHDIGGWGKAGWIIFLIVLPFLAALIYLIAEGKGMAERDVADYQAMQSAQEGYIRSVAGSGGASAADEVAKLAALRDRGVLTNEEFEAQKAALLS
ncbi:MAG TPA: SHOCT domain-containing protein [Acidimicrobiia bacterium]|nr:SHOCT domain-containing protein [Acidimicrobiia bacterium]